MWQVEFVSQKGARFPSRGDMDLGVQDRCSGCAGQCVRMHACSERGVGWLCMLGPHPSLILCGGFPLVAETSCAATEFRCRDGTCIGNSSRCNQFIDCEDASDEMNCSECRDCTLFFLLPLQL